MNPLPPFADYLDELSTSACEKIMKTFYNNVMRKRKVVLKGFELIKLQI